MTMYKIIGENNDVIRTVNSDGSITCFQEGSPGYDKFIQDIAEQGYDIVEGPDVKSLSYAELRMAEYPSREEQFDMQFHDQVNETTTWRDTIQAIKDRYPKTITGSTTIGPIPDWVQEAVNAYNPES